jgi:nucleoside-diphosphate-sugar epimerase
MKVLITGNMGYVGPILVRSIKSKYPDAQLWGYDTGFFSTALIEEGVLPEMRLHGQYFGDIRDINSTLLADVDVVVHLAAVSNDPMGKEFERVTSDINRQASVNFVRVAAQAGVKQFVFASSCSMYGLANGGLRRESDPLNPLTAYARSKAGVEEDVSALDLGQMVFTSLRFATACGWSPRIRLDLVLNDFVASAVATKKITVLSDGTPWRPLIDVEDMSRAIIWAMSRKPAEGGDFLVVNVGSSGNNYQVKHLADEVARQVPGTSVVINRNALPDSRSYAVDFSLYEKLAPDYQPKVSLAESIKRIAFGLYSFKFRDTDIGNSSLIRLNMLKKHISDGKLSRDLRWII